jgi:hypothetical protein
MRLRLGVLALLCALAAISLPAPATSEAQPKGVVEPKLRALKKEPAVRHLRHFLHALKSRDHASRRAHRRLEVRKQRFSSAARGVPRARDRKRRRSLRAYLKKPGRHHRGWISEQSLAYYSFLLSLETYKIRHIVARISDEIDRLAYS